MKNILVLTLLFLGTTSSTLIKDIQLDKPEALKAFQLLNDIRTHPENYQSEFSFLKNFIAKGKLTWNDTLARVAETKALDMANRNYFEHVNPSGYGMNYDINQSGYKLPQDWVKDKSLNYFESIAVNAADGERVIRLFIIDEGVPSLGHRKHLLGLDDWNASLTDIGIGFVRCHKGCTYQTYVSLIIAKHK